MAEILSYEEMDKLLKITDDEYEQLEVTELANDLTSVLVTIKELQVIEKDLKSKILPLVKEIDRYNGEEIDISYATAYNSLTFDSTKFKKDNPDLFNEYNTKVRKTGESIKCKLK